MSLDTARMSACATLLLLVASCGSRSSGPAAAGFAYTAPATLNLRAELGLQAPATATLQHGERVEILETRRRFVRVRAANGATGWTDSALLLTQTQIDDLKALAERAASIPSQGVATVFDALNVHTAPSRPSPTILQLKEGEKVDVVAHRISPRTVSVAAASVSIEPKHPPPAREKKKNNSPGPPPPAPPPLPSDWKDLSRPRLADLVAPPVARELQMDDWFLVRTADGRAGWVLMRQVLMQVPDEVAQYAERQLITSYHALGETHTTKGEQKNHWLWTTLVKGSQPYDFDTFRVFIYNPRKDRYETVAIDRNLKGHFPVELSTGPDGTTFSLLVEDKDRGIQKRTYLFKDLHARVVSKVPSSVPNPLPEVRPATSFDAPPRDDESWIKRTAKKWFGG